MNSGSAQVRFYDDDGGYLGAIGGNGDGPGEFRSPWKVHQIAGDSLFVIDLYREISIFDAHGNFVRRFLPQRPEGEVLGEGFEPVDPTGSARGPGRPRATRRCGTVRATASRSARSRSMGTSAG